MASGWWYDRGSRGSSSTIDLQSNVSHVHLDPGKNRTQPVNPARTDPVNPNASWNGPSQDPRRNVG